MTTKNSTATYILHIFSTYQLANSYIDSFEAQLKDNGIDYYLKKASNRIITVFVPNDDDQTISEIVHYFDVINNERQYHSGGWNPTGYRDVFRFAGMCFKDIEYHEPVTISDEDRKYLTTRIRSTSKRISLSN